MSINYSGINENYPTPGVDNDSQGFRDNFTLIKNGLGVADSALTDLQAKVVLKSALAGTTLDNDFGNNPITNAVFVGCGSNVLPLAQFDNPTNDVSYTAGGYHIIQVNTDTVIRIVDWPTTSYAKIVLQIKSDSTTPRTVDLKTASYINGSLADGTVYYSADVPSNISISSELIHTLIECWSPDGGATMFVNYLGLYTAP